MKLDIFLQKTSNLKGENKLLKLIIALIGITVLINTVMLFKAINTHKTILVPFNFEITATGANDEYIKATTQYIASLAFTWSPATVRRQFSELLTFYDADSFPKARQSFYELADTIETTRTSSVFYTHKISILNDEKKVEIIGIKKQYIEDKKTEENQKTYIVRYKIENGRFWITDISEKTTTT